jgi:hypothetical protein
MKSHLGRSACLLVAGTLLAWAIDTRSASAAPNLRKPSSMTHSGEGHIISELEQAKTLLEKADHDYDGHRAKAVGEIQVAIHALKPHHTGKQGEHPTKTGEKPAKNGGGNKEPQEVSDAQLKKALGELQSIHKQLGSLKAEHHTKASTAVGKAIEELHTALKIK